MGFRFVPMITEDQIEKRVKEIGAEITRDYKGKQIMMVGILKGAINFMCRLMDVIDNDTLTIDFISASSYGNSTESSGVVRILKDLDTSIEGLNVLIVEDIVDTGLTMKKLTELLKTRNPASIKICTLLDKPSRRTVDIKPDYVGFEIENKFVAGFGLDYEDRYRQLKFVGEVVFD